MNTKLFFILLFIIALFSKCEKKRHYNQIDAAKYNELLDSLNSHLHCPQGSSENYFEASIDGKDLCYKDGIENYKFKFYNYNSIVTESPTINVGSNQNYSNLMKLHEIEFLSVPKKYGKEIFIIDFPHYYPNRTAENYLDSLFAIKFHEVKSLSDGIMPDDRDTTKFIVAIQMIKYFNDTNSGNAYSVSSKYGDQSDSYIEIEKVKKTVSDTKITYTLDMSLECYLYYDITFREEGLWGKLEEGKLHVTFSIKNK